MRTRVAVIALLCWSGCSNRSSATDDGGADDMAAPPADMAVSGNCSYKYCEDFESYGGPVTNAQSLGPWTATVSAAATDMGTSMVSASVDSVNPSHGGKSLHITVTRGPAARATLHQKAAAGLIPGNNLYGRAMVYYSSTNGSDLPIGVHSWLFNASGPAARDGGGAGIAAMNMGGGGNKLQLNYHPPTGGESSVQGGMITAAAWHCVQWQYDGAHNSAAVWIDGTAAVTIAGSKGWELAMLWDSFDFGFTHYQVLDNSVEIFLDDFALDSSMIPCP